MSSTGPVVRNGQIVQAPALLDLLRTVWRRLRPRSHVRMRRAATLSDHLLADVGLNGPGHETAELERHIHRH